MKKSESKPERLDNAAQLVDDFELGSDAEFFADPEARLEFLRTLEFDEFLSITQHIDSRMRGLESRLSKVASENGAHLPMLATPSSVEKPDALRAGFDVIKTYLDQSDDDVHAKIRGSAMAVEALIIWVHPFNDGNGRTSRFWGKFIEDGTTDIDQLIEQTASNDSRQRMYDEYLRVDQGNLIKGQDVILDDAEIEKYKETEMPVGEGISLSLMRLLNEKSYQDRVDAQTARYRRLRSDYESKQQSVA